MKETDNLLDTAIDHSQKNEIDVSVVIPISERHDSMKLLYNLYADELTNLGKSFEFIFILDGNFIDAFADLQQLHNEGYPVRIIHFTKNFGESAAIMEGFRQAHGNAILTLASYIQIEPSELEKVFSAYDEGKDLIITRRFPRKDPYINQIQSRLFHFLVRKMTGAPFNDITSGMRLINRNVLSEFVLYGDLHRFIPIFALQKGLQVKEVNVAQSKADTQIRLVKPGVYLRRCLDILTLFFLVKFTYKPLRFFGLMGTSLFIPGFVITFLLGLLKILGGFPLSNRPLLLLGFLLLVFGLQMFSVGLVGELILFSHAKEIQDYKIKEIIE